MSVTPETGMHFPRDPTRFSFDGEVAAIFDNMALRSLPGYAHVYQQIEQIIRRSPPKPYQQVWDFGVSTGAGLTAVRQGANSAFVDYHGADLSEPMLARTKVKCPWAVLHHYDLDHGLPKEVVKGEVAVAIFGWTLQFLESPARRRALLRETYEALAPGGLLFVMEKWEPTSEVMGQVVDETYYHWRRDNGYALEEIRAKSKALTNAMWPWSRGDLNVALALAGFDPARVMDLYRLYTFGGVLAIK